MTDLGVADDSAWRALASSVGRFVRRSLTEVRTNYVDISSELLCAIVRVHWATCMDLERKCAPRAWCFSAGNGIPHPHRPRIGTWMVGDTVVTHISGDRMCMYHPFASFPDAELFAPFALSGVVGSPYAAVGLGRSTLNVQCDRPPFLSLDLLYALQAWAVALGDTTTDCNVAALLRALGDTHRWYYAGATVRTTDELRRHDA